MSRNAEVQAPMARASDRMAAAEVTLVLLSRRKPKKASARSDSSQVTSLMLRIFTSGLKELWSELVIAILYVKTSEYSEKFDENRAGLTRAGNQRL